MAKAYILNSADSAALLAKEISGCGSGAVVFAAGEAEAKFRYEMRRLGAYELAKSEEAVFNKVAFGAELMSQSFIKKASEAYKINCVMCKGRISSKIVKICESNPVVMVSDLSQAQRYKDLTKKDVLSFDKTDIKKGSVSMDINSSNVEEIVKRVLAQMSGSESAPATKKASGAVPAKSKAAMLTKLEHFDIVEYPIPELGDDDILVKVEGCGVCGTDAHEFKRDPFGLIPVLLGHEGTGEIVKMGKNVKVDSAGKPLNIGDKIVTCVTVNDDPYITMFDLNKQNVGSADVYGLLPDDDVHLNGWFADYIVVRGGSTIFNVSDLDLDSRILVEPCAVLVHAVERAKTTGILRFNSRVVVQGCGPIGLICIAVLRTMGIENITAVDGEQKRLDFALRMGATKTVNFKDHKGIEALTDAVKDSFGGYLCDFAFQCTGSPIAHANIYKFIRSGGGLCELGFFINGGDATINPHFDICSKEITTVGSWVYTARDYATTFDFLKRAKGIGLPMKELITHKFPLDKINEALQTNLKMEGLKIAIVNE